MLKSVNVLKRSYDGPVGKEFDDLIDLCTVLYPPCEVILLLLLDAELLCSVGFVVTIHYV